MALVLIESTVATRGESSTSYGTRCCTKERAEALDCTVTAPADATSKQLITGAKGNLPNLKVTMAGWTYGQTAKNPSVSGNTGGGTVTYTYKAEGASSYSSTKPTNAGTHTVKATVAETTNYISKSVTTTFLISKATPTITWSSLPNYMFVGETGTVSATASNSATITYSSDDTTVATISNKTVTAKKIGDSKITASVAATTNYNAASVDYTLRVVVKVNVKINKGSLSGVGTKATEIHFKLYDMTSESNYINVRPDTITIGSSSYTTVGFTKKAIEDLEGLTSFNPPSFLHITDNNGNEYNASINKALASNANVTFTLTSKVS